MVAYIVAHWEHDWHRDLFIGFAVVLLQLPATYVRSYPLYAYSGTVTSFTVALILLARNVSTQYAVNRIIDTYVGVAMYLAMELTIAVTFTEDELISDMARVFQGVQDRFINMHRNFQFFKAYAFAALVYLALVSVIVIAARALEKRVIIPGVYR